MKTFNCNVRLGGNVLCDVPKYDLTEMEIRVLQAIHGDDAVINIKTSGDADRSESEEAGRLAEQYSPKVVSEVTGIKNIVPLLVDEDDEQPEQPQATANKASKAKAAIE